MRAMCMERVVGRRVALEREESMRWFDHNRYLALIDKLAAAGNLEVCFVLGLKLVFTQGRTDPVGTALLRQAAVADHKVAAYVLGVLHYGDEEAEQYIRQVESEGEGDVVAHRCKQCRSYDFMGPMAISSQRPLLIMYKIL